MGVDNLTGLGYAPLCQTKGDYQMSQDIFYDYQPTEEDWRDYEAFCLLRKQEEIEELKTYHRERMPERFFNLVVWDYEFPETEIESEIVNSTIEIPAQLEIQFFETTEIHF